MNSSAFMENLKQLFAECDTDNNGSLGRDEFSTLCAKIGLNKDAAKETFDRLDSDNNDRITFEEFAAGFNQYKQTSPTQQSAQQQNEPLRSSHSQSHNRLPNTSSSNPSTPKLSRSPIASRSQRLSPTVGSPGPVSLRTKKSASPLGVISLGSTGSSGLRSSSSTTGISSSTSSNHHDNNDALYTNSIDDNSNNNNNDGSDMVVYSSESFNNDDQASGSGQYGSLMSSCSSLNQLRNVQDLLDCVQKLQSENQILTQIFFKDKREREEYISQLGEEFDQQVREVEERAHRRAKEELENEKKRLREMMATERETLQHHYQTIERMSKLVKSPNGKLDDGESIDKVKSKLEDTYLENRQLKKSLLDTKTDVALIWKEMEKLKRQYEEKLSNAYERNNETKSECDHIKQQLNLMKDSNKKLQDASDVITNYITDKVEPVIKVATSGGDSLDDTINGSLKYNHSQSNSRRGSILSEYINGDESNSLDGYNGSNNSGDLESMGSSVTKTSHRGANRTLVEDADIESLSAGSSLTGNFHLKVPKATSKGQLDFRNTQKPASDQQRTSKDDKSTVSRTQPNQDDSIKEQATNSKLDQESSNKTLEAAKPGPGLRGIGRHFFMGSRASSDSKLDQQAKEPTTEAEMKQSVSIDGHDEPLVEPSDGPSKATFNIILVGDSFVGKSSFAARFMEGSFVQGLISNCSIDFKTKAYKVDGTNYTVNLWDTAGQERFRSITASYFRKADGIILMYDVTDKRSYLNVRNWMSTISDTAAENVAVLLVGNKIDLRQKANSDKCVPTEEGVRLAKEYEIVFLETSVKTGLNLVPSMGRLIRLIAKNSQPPEDESDRIRLNDKSRTFNCMPKNC